MRKISVFSPYRISFGGGGTDISPFPEMYGGCVINTTIEKGIRLNYVDDGFPLEISSRDLLKSWSFSKKVHNDFLEGVTMLFKERGIDRGRLSLSGDVPPGTGLGTSSSLILGLLRIIKVVNDEEITKENLASETYDVEKNFFGITLGRQDPYAISFGGMKYVEFTKEGYKMEMFDHDSPFIKLLEKSTLMVYTGSSHDSSAELQEQVSKLKDGSDEMIDLLLEIKKSTKETKESIEEEDFGTFISSMNRGWELKKRLGKNITNQKVDSLIDIAIENGAGAARLMGGGSEGFVLVVADYRKIWDIQRKMMEFSDYVTRVSFDLYGTRGIDSS